MAASSKPDPIPSSPKSPGPPTSAAPSASEINSSARTTPIAKLTSSSAAVSSPCPTASCSWCRPKSCPPDSLRFFPGARNCAWRRNYSIRPAPPAPMKASLPWSSVTTDQKWLTASPIRSSPASMAEKPRASASAPFSPASLRWSVLTAASAAPCWPPEKKCRARKTNPRLRSLHPLRTECSSSSKPSSRASTRVRCSRALPWNRFSATPKVGSFQRDRNPRTSMRSFSLFPQASRQRFF